MSAPRPPPAELSSPDGSDHELARPTASSAVLSPPNSQHHDHPHAHLATPHAAMPTPATGANSNGKRPIQTISNGNDEGEDMTNGKSRGDAAANLPPQTHAASGYTWTRGEDEPGYAWLNKKAVDEHERAWDHVAHKDLMVKNRYGDPFEAVEREQAVLASLQQR